MSFPVKIAFAPLLGASLLLARPVTPAAAQDRPGGPRLADHVVLVSIDGLRPEFYLDAETWPAPVLQQAATAGAHALGMRSVFPSVTYPAHTTLLTGALPARHGVYYNEPFEPGGQTGRWYWEAEAVRVPTLWDAVRAAGDTAVALSWPATVGAPIALNVPEMWSLDGSERRDEIARRVSTPPGLMDELEREATGSLVPVGPDGPDEGAWTRGWWDERTARMAEYVLERYRPALLAVHLIDVDHQQHDHGRDHPAVVRALGAADAALGRLVEAARRVGILERTAFVVVGDHGFIDATTQLAPNVWLVDGGLLPASDPPLAGGDDAWRARFHSGGGSAFLHLRDPDDAAAVAAVRRILGDLDPGVRARFRVVERNELDRLGADPSVPLALGAAEGVSFTLRRSGPAVLRGYFRGTHGYVPDGLPDILTGFVAWGAGVQPGTVVDRLEIEDVAPLVAALLGLD
ncbi:MAG TPA: alkaline phosphatase family protein, partial [Longimicrobiales bacterium]|nr:alkaline phosphatase family protein [Longimicrobiales bacterium]